MKYLLSIIGLIAWTGATVYETATYVSGKQRTAYESMTVQETQRILAEESVKWEQINRVLADQLATVLAKIETAKPVIAKHEAGVAQNVAEFRAIQAKQVAVVGVPASISNAELLSTLRKMGVHASVRGGK